eukprot:TRINITY_DN396_c0_g2_i1.p1 TRINITY_DN396_c0_g2~~TRINITY_DN396_c0_g2_i1.p1  ORF type:complete len:114 (+),score=41.20 TRINITY_DN396_c0_g2_i1:130-471(+)
MCIRDSINAEYGENCKATMSWMESMRNSASELADTTERKAKTAKCNAEILYANRNINQIKEAFGLMVWDALFAGDTPTVEALKAEHLVKVEEQLAIIREKEAFIERLSVPGGR